MKMNKYHSLLALVAFLILSGCETEEQPITRNTINDSITPLTKVSLQLNWFPEAEHGGYYAALIHGAYQEEGLDVEIIGGGPNSPVIQKGLLSISPRLVENFSKKFEYKSSLVMSDNSCN